jgi:CheY-like chemotaxis protein
VGQAGFRIVQDSVTNVMRHARASRIHVRIATHGNTLLIDVADDGQGATNGRYAGGHGLRGMAERAAAATGREAVSETRRTHPDLVLMDIRMPDTDGLDATQLITTDRTLSRTRVLVLTTFELDKYVFGALRAGASGFLLKGGTGRPVARNPDGRSRGIALGAERYPAAHRGVCGPADTSPPARWHRRTDPPRA